MSDKDKGKDEKDKGKDDKKKFSFFVDDTKYDTENSSITGAFVTSQITGFDPKYALWLEGDPDRQVLAADSFDLAAAHGHLRFYLVPPANFGSVP